MLGRGCVAALAQLILACQIQPGLQTVYEPVPVELEGSQNADGTVAERVILVRLGGFVEVGCGHRPGGHCGTGIDSIDARTRVTQHSLQPVCGDPRAGHGYGLQQTH